MPVRLIRDGILTSEPVCSLSWPSEVLYRRLMSVVDDYGRFHANSRLIRAACYPLQIDKVSDADIGKWLTECVTAALVSVYPASDGKRYLQIEKFGQQIRSKSKFPEPDGDVPLTSVSNCEQQKTVDSNCVQMEADVVEVGQHQNSPDDSCKHVETGASHCDQHAEPVKSDSKLDGANIPAKNDSKLELSDMLENHGVITCNASDNNCKQLSATAHLGVCVFGVEDEGGDGCDMRAQAHAHPPAREDGDAPPDGGADRVVLAARFAEFYAVYPKKAGRAEALKAWKAKKLDRLADTIIADVKRRQVEHRGWLEGFTPNPATYLRGERWTDEIEPIRKASVTAVPQSDDISQTLHSLPGLQGLEHLSKHGRETALAAQEWIRMRRSREGGDS